MTGFININKAAGVSSAREVAVVKRLTGSPCGHMGTLDPMAVGVLPVGIGNACRLFDYFLTKRKTYLATFRFGEDYDTLDTTGTIVAEGGAVPSMDDIRAVLPSLVGDVMQVPPRYSARSVGGRRGYAMARAGEDFTLPPKKVSIYSIEAVSRRSETEYDFIIECGWYVNGHCLRVLALSSLHFLRPVTAASFCNLPAVLRRARSCRSGILFPVVAP